MGSTLEHPEGTAPRAPEATTETDLVGQHILQFHVVGRLGEGGMGVVYKAVDEKLRRRVALKVLNRRYLADERNKELIFREARNAAAVTHANIAAIYDVLDTPDGALIAMELVEGETLRARLRRGRLPVTEALRIAREIARGVARAHEIGVVHRDLKPDNVMLTREGHVKLLDFGLATAVLDTEPLVVEGDASPGLAATVPVTRATRGGRVMGTPAYMAPEQAAGDPVDARADVFSFGAVLFELLVNEAPFAHRTTTLPEWTDADWQPVVPLRVKRPEVAKELEAIVARCLEVVPEDRFANAGEVAAALEALPATPRRRGLLIGGAVVGALAIGAVVLWPRPAAAPALATIDAGPGLDALLTYDDAPASPTKSPEALALFHDAMRMIGLDHLRGGLAKLDAAVKLDPAFAAAHLQLAFNRAMLTDLADGREHYAKAVEARTTLAPRDRELLDAIEPAFRDPPDWQGEAKGLAAFVARRSGDSAAWAALGVAQMKYGDFDEALHNLEHQAALEPKSPASHTLRAQIELRQRHNAAATATLADCLVREPREVPCLAALVQLSSLAGRCKDVELEARQLTTLAPTTPEGWTYRANAAVVLGEPEVAVAELLVQRRSSLPPDDKARAEISDRRTLALWRGDFGEVLKVQDQLDAQDKPAPAALIKSAGTRALFLFETGDRAAAARAAAGAVDRFAALPRFEQVQGDLTMALTNYMVAGGLLSKADYIKRRDAWVAAWRARIDATAWKSLGFIVWFKAYAEGMIGPVGTDDDARAALALLPQFAELPPAGSNNEDLATGVVLLRAGRVADAMSRLEARAHACEASWDVVMANRWLGEAREQAGDRKGACEAYRVVLARWGHPKPRSVTVDEARARASKLGCLSGP